MQDNKQRNYYVDWWHVRKSLVYGAAGIIALLALICLGGWMMFREDGWLSKQESTEFPKDAARLVSFEGEVRVVRAATRETILVTRPTYVLAGDTIQTQGDGKAQIAMIDGSTLSVRPNSTVVIRDSSSLFGGQNVRVALDGGQINVKTEEQTEATNNVVEVRQSENRVFPQTDASFGINQKSGGGEIRISRGGVETSIGGEKTVINTGEFASLNENGKLSGREKLFDAPKPIQPNALGQIFTGASGTSDVTFRWQKPNVGAAFNYRMEVSTSPLFAADAVVTEREPLANPGVSLAALSPGVYFWRVRAAAASGQTSDWSEPSKFTILKPEAGAPLEVSDWTTEKIGGTIYIVGGRTQPGASVRVAGRETFAASDGAFKIQISAALPEAVVEIADERGNRNRMVLSLKTAKIVR